VAHEWGTETGELTPTLKLRRRAVLDKYAREIEMLYAPSSQ
jgi:long-chain acyl-CoA synthetase